jgi:methionyl-tRNA formyltransferase
VTYAERLTKADGRIDWTSPAVHVERMLRAFYPWPGAYTAYQGKQLRFLDAGVLPQWAGDQPPGAVFSLPCGQVAVATGQGALVLHELQLAGKKPMPIEVFCRGQRDFVGSILG